jgi:hypothetical protein
MPRHSNFAASRSRVRSIDCSVSIEGFRPEFGDFSGSAGQKLSVGLPGLTAHRAFLSLHAAFLSARAAQDRGQTVIAFVTGELEAPHIRARPRRLRRPLRRPGRWIVDRHLVIERVAVDRRQTLRAPVRCESSPRGSFARSGSSCSLSSERNRLLSSAA